MSSISSLAGAHASAVQSFAPPAATKPAARDGDGDNDASGSATSKTAQTASTRKLDVTA